MRDARLITLTMAAAAAAAVAAVAACGPAPAGSTMTGSSAGGAAMAAADATFDAAPQFPAGAAVIHDFAPDELAGLGVAVAGFVVSASTGGTADAPADGTVAMLRSSGSQMVFTFAEPIHGFGLTAIDIDHEHDPAVVVTVTGLDASGGKVAEHQATIATAETEAEEPQTARFIGWTTAAAVVEVRVGSDQYNAIGLDDIRFTR